MGREVRGVPLDFGWAPSMVAFGGKVMSGVEALTQGVSDA